MPHETRGPSLSPSLRLSGTDDVPEDVLAERDAEERRAHPPAPSPVSTRALPEDVRAEQDLELRLADEEQRLEQAEGVLPEEPEPRS